MMKKIIFNIILATYSLIGAGQNLVQNPGFENYSSLPSTVAQWSLAYNWSNANSPTASPDYLHLNGSGMVQLPNSVFGTISPYQGNALMGLAMWHRISNDFREYISQSLATPLTVGRSYTFSFYISNGIPGMYGGTGIQNVQVDFSVDPINQILSTPLGYTPLLSSRTMIYSNNWIKISYTFIATAPYVHFAIGNFMNDANTITEQFNSTVYPSAYYFIDEVSLILNPKIKDDPQSEITLEMPNLITPNNDGLNDLFVPIISKGIVSMNTIIYNRWGTEIYETDNPLIEWDGEYVSDGIYYWIVYYTDINGVKNNLEGWVNILK